MTEFQGWMILFLLASILLKMGKEYNFLSSLGLIIMIFSALGSAFLTLLQK